MNVLATGLSDVGNVRKNNEDSFASIPEHGVFVVCDGMGGHAAGEIASAMARDLIVTQLSAAEPLRQTFAGSDDEDVTTQFVKEAESSVLAAARAIYDDALKTPGRAGMGTTCSVIWLAGRKGVLTHVGDSRVYVVRNRALYQLSEDHTFVAEQVKRGLMTKEEAARSKKGNVLTRALGPVESVAVDTMLFDVDPDDRFLLCSDGLHHYFPDSQELLRAILDTRPEVCAERLVSMAKERGGHDNITVVVVHAQGTPKLMDDEDTAASRLQMLKRIPLFQYLTYPELVKVISSMHSEHHEAGSLLIREDRREDKLYVCVAGTLEIFRGGQLIAELPSGVHVGEMALVDNSPRSASVICKTRSHLLSLDRARFHEIIRREPVVGTKLLWAFTQELSRRLRETNDNLQAAKEELHELSPTQEVAVPFDDDEVIEVTDL